MIDITPTTTMRGGHFPFSKLGLSGEQEDDVLDLTRLCYDQYTHKIRQERRKFCARNPAKPLAVTTQKDIVMDTRKNPKMIASVGTAFATATK